MQGQPVGPCRIEAASRSEHIEPGWYEEHGSAGPEQGTVELAEPDDGAIE